MVKSSRRISSPLKLGESRWRLMAWLMVFDRRRCRLSGSEYGGGGWLDCAGAKGMREVLGPGSVRFALSRSTGFCVPDTVLSALWSPSSSGWPIPAPVPETSKPQLPQTSFKLGGSARHWPVAALHIRALAAVRSEKITSASTRVASWPSRIARAVLPLRSTG